MSAALTPVEYLYGTTDERDDHFEVTGRREVVAFRIVKKTAKRIYYVRAKARFVGDKEEIGYVDRQAMEASGPEGLWARKTAGWWEDDNRLYLEPPDVSPVPLPDHKKLLSRLKAEMAAVHPDRGGTDEEFIAARVRYEQARGAA